MIIRTFCLWLVFCILFSSVLEAKEIKRKSRRVTAVGTEQPKHTYDLSISFGSYDDVSYTEGNLGINYFLDHWLVWRNAAFVRFASGQDTVFGLDTSARAIFTNYEPDSTTYLTSFVGPGFRIPSAGKGAPFLEAGLVFHFGGLSLGGSAKYLFYPTQTPSSDLVWSLILSGGGVL